MKCKPCGNTGWIESGDTTGACLMCWIAILSGFDRIRGERPDLGYAGIRLLVEKEIERTLTADEDRDAQEAFMRKRDR